jgi:hypothetical protein
MEDEVFRSEWQLAASNDDGYNNNINKNFIKYNQTRVVVVPRHSLALG